MSDKDAGTPRLFLARHGETEWTINGRYTGVTELPLTPNGERQVLGSGRALVGSNKLINPSRLAAVYISPRQRAQQTYDLLFPGPAKTALAAADKVHTTSRLAEWDYGAYEGLLTKEIRARRATRGLDGERPWDIWRDGCEDGESPAEVTARLDDLIREIRDMQRPYMHGEKPVDVVLVAHGHLLRAFAKRWLGYSMETPLSMMMAPGGVGVLSYQHHSVDEPAFLLGLALPLAEEAAEVEEVKN
ncbi:phosphoglycerate mutase [Phyllosticta citribraziliensis]|uniref:Phosphoglycerate mutase n=1 Tax=Phyllosticta citribraziliensis TaxID=989973 RepID=A0ABR1LQN6_9PEZI